MIIPFSWLKEYVDIEISAEEMQEKFFSCGFEVEELTYVGKEISGVVVGKITKTAPHPNADRLTVCTVDCGSFGVKQICTAATNVFEGALVPCALDGAIVRHEDGSMKIKSGKLRGELSEGMFCSGEELGIGDDFYDGAEVNGILILHEGNPGEDVRKIVGLDDWLFDIAVTANRPDCQSVYGMAREAAAVLRKPLKPLKTTYNAVPTVIKIPVTVEDFALCPRYIGQYVTDVKTARSPQWLRRRLALSGLRSVNAIVDITNYVLLEVGQPMHAFDANKLRGGKIVVRRARAGEKIVTLDKKEFTLNENNLLVCDGEGGVALAGVMGGLNSEIGADTQAVFFEAAKFARDSVRKTSRALGQRSDSSARFEKGVDAFLPSLAMDRALHLVEEIGCGVPTTYRTDALSAPLTPKTVRVSYQKLNDLLGIQVPRDEAEEILTRLQFQVSRGKGDELIAEVPLWREDVEGYPDLAEEIIRMYGYEHITPTFLTSAQVTHGGLSLAQEQELKFKTVLAEEGFFEACNYSFCSPKDFDLLRFPADAPERRAVTILNPIGEDLSVMRTTLAPTMLADMVRNVRRGNEAGRLFEIANVFLAKELPLQELPEERKTCVLGLWGAGDFFDLKGAIEAVAEAFGLKLTFERGEKPFLHPGVTAFVKLGEKTVGYLGELHPEIAASLSLEKKVYLAELDYAALERKFARDISYHNPPKFRNLERDIAVVVDEEITCAQVEGCILNAVKAAKEAELFDVYRSPLIGLGKKSMALRITFAPDENAEKPLTPEAVEGYFQKILNALKRNLGGELR